MNIADELGKVVTELEFDIKTLEQIFKSNEESMEGMRFAMAIHNLSALCYRLKQIKAIAPKI